MARLREPKSFFLTPLGERNQVASSFACEPCGCRTIAGVQDFLRKEVIQPQVPLRLPCYDLVPITSLAVGTPEMRRLRALPAPMT